jgi:hypothetical protein
MPAFYPHVFILLTLATAVNTGQTGSVKKLRTPPGDDQNNAEQAFVAVFELTAAGGSSPTLDAVVETSWDGNDWHTVASMTQLSGAGSKRQIVDIEHLGPQVRVKVTPGGSTAPNVTGSVSLASTGRFGVS